MATDCRTVQELATASAPLDAEARSHLDGCGHCRAAVDALERIVQSRAEPAPRALAGFAARVRTAHERDSGRWQPLVYAGGGFAAAAAALVLVVSGIGADPRNAFTPGPYHATTAAIRMAGNGPEAESAPSDALASEAAAVAVDAVDEDWTGGADDDAYLEGIFGWSDEDADGVDEL